MTSAPRVASHLPGPGSRDADSCNNCYEWTAPELRAPEPGSQGADPRNNCYETLSPNHEPRSHSAPEHERAVCSARRAGEPLTREVQRGHVDGVVQLVHEAVDLAWRHEHDFGVFTRFEPLLGHDVCPSGQVQVRQVPPARGLGRDAQEVLPIVGGVARLFEQFTARSVAMRLARVDAPGGELQRLAAETMTVLAHEHELAVAGDRDDTGPVAGVDERIFLEDCAATGLDAIYLEREPGPLPHDLAVEHLPGFHGRLHTTPIRARQGRPVRSRREPAADCARSDATLRDRPPNSDGLVLEGPARGLWGFPL